MGKIRAPAKRVKIMGLFHWFQIQTLPVRKKWGHYGFIFNVYCESSAVCNPGRYVYFLNRNLVWAG